MSKEAIKLALDTFRRLNHEDSIFAGEFDEEVKALEEALAKQEQGEPVAVKHLIEWVDYLKRKSDYGQHMKIPSEMSAGACWELAVELEQFINTTPQQRTWVGLTDEEVLQLIGGMPHGKMIRAIEAKLREKNT